MDKRESKRIPKTSGIYLIVNPNGKKYVGQSKNLRKRYRDYLQKSWLKSPKNKSKIKHSFAKYGFENHFFEILEELDIQLLAEREDRWITVLDTLKNGLNTIDRNYTIFEFKRNKGKTTWTDERKVEHSRILKIRHEEGCYKDRNYTKLSKARKGLVSAWDKEEEEFVSITKEEFDKNERFVGTTSKEVPGVKHQPKKPIKDLKTGIVYEGVVECIEKVGKSSCFVYVGLKKGDFEYC